MNKNKLLSCLSWFIRLLLRLRYRIEVEGLDKIPQEKWRGSSGFLFLPNHSAEIDPVIVLTLLWRRFHPHPLVAENFYYLKGIKFFMRLVGALPLPNIEGAVNKWKINRVDKLFKQVATELKQGDNFLIYPSGRLKLTAMEMVGGASFVHGLIQACPDANIVLVRITGLWGSSFSRALIGSSPDFAATLFDGVKVLLKNAIFFAPRRKVKVEFSLPPEDFPYGGTRLEINQYLEQWYNRYPEPGSEPLALVSYSFWKTKLPEVSSSSQSREAEERAISPAIEKEVMAQLAELSQRSLTEIRREMHLSQDLGLDSLDVAQIYLFLDERYGIDNLPHGGIQTVADVLQAAAGYKGKKRSEPEQLLRSFWPEEPRRLPGSSPRGDTIQEAFLLACSQRKKEVACADELSGVVTYQKLKRVVSVLALKIREIPEENIGILLPSSVAAYSVILATLLAGKIPVMLNWTAGVRSLNHSLELTSLGTVISSRRFLDRLQNGDLGAVDEHLLLLEDLRDSLSWVDKLRGLFFSFKSTKQLLSQCPKGPDDPAVILFTSGTETLPKAVPLTHGNILSNLRGGLSFISFQPQELLYGVLPPFHSFGFSITGLMPLLAGLKVFFAPDPTDSHGLERDIFRYKPTIFCCAPSFLLSLFRLAHPEKLQSIRLFVSGAEKTPEELFALVKTQLIEGYGITECGPIVTLNRLDAPRRGVGFPLPDTELNIIDVNSLKPLPLGEEGEILIRSPSVFRGYIGEKNRSPFITIGEKKWYRSGDRGYLDSEGALFLSGRLKRFVKMGGEMVSLGGLEEELLRLSKEKNWEIPGEKKGPSLAVGVREKEGEKPLIILFTTFEISKEVVNSALAEGGFGRLVKIAEVKKMEEIPLTGTGKTHYRLLDEIITHETKTL